MKSMCIYTLMCLLLTLLFNVSGAGDRGRPAESIGEDFVTWREKFWPAVYEHFRVKATGDQINVRQYTLETHLPYTLETHLPYTLETYLPYTLETYLPYTLETYLPYSLETHLPYTLETYLPYTLETYLPYTLESYLPYTLETYDDLPPEKVFKGEIARILSFEIPRPVFGFVEICNTFMYLCIVLGILLLLRKVAQINTYYHRLAAAISKAHMRTQGALLLKERAQTKLDQQQNRFQTLHADFQAYREECKKILKGLKRTRKEKKAAKIKLQVQQSRFQTLQANFQTYREECMNTLKVLFTKEDEFERMNVKLDSYKSQIERLQRHKQASSTDLEEEKTRTRTARTEMKNDKIKFRAEEKRAQYLEKEIATLKKLLENAQNKLKVVQDHTDNRVKFLQSSFDKQILAMEQQLISSKSQLEQMKIQRRDAAQELLRVHKRNEELDRSILKNNGRMNTMEQEFKAYKNSVETNYIEKASLEAAKRDIEARCQRELNLNLKRQRDELSHDNKFQEELERKELEAKRLNDLYMEETKENTTLLDNINDYVHKAIKFKTIFSEPQNNSSSTNLTDVIMTFHGRAGEEVIMNRLRTELERNIARHLEAAPHDNIRALLRRTDFNLGPLSCDITVNTKWNF